MGIQLLQNFLPRLLDVHIQVFQNLRGDAIAFAQEAEQDVFGADIGVVERLGFLGRERQHFFHAWRLRDVANDLLVGPSAGLLFHRHADGFEVETHFLEHVDGHALSEFDEAEQKVFGADDIVVKTVGFLPRQGQHLLRPGREIDDGFIQK